MEILKTYEMMNKLPQGKLIFSKAVCLRAPYFASIAPRVRDLRVGQCEITMKKRRSVTNHINTVHAIAMCNLAELCAGLCIDASLPKSKRWIPKGMSVKYLAKAETDLVGTCAMDPAGIVDGDNDLDVVVKNTAGTDVFSARITMYVSNKRSN